MIDLAWLWDDRRDANVGLFLCSDSSPTPCKKRVLLHSVIIASASGYFRKCLTTDVGRIKDRARSVSYAEALEACECKYEVFEQVDSPQVSAAMAVLEMMYKQVVPKEKPSVELLLGMLLMSDRWMASDCVALCQTAFAALVPSSLRLEDLQAIYSTPKNLQSLHLLAPVMLLANEALLLLFGNVVTVISTPLLANQMLQLPYAAMLALLSSSDLVTDSEDSVLMMLSWWLEGDIGQGCEGTELQALQIAVRYSQLSMTYLVQVVPQFPRLSPGQNKLLDLIEYRHWIAAHPDNILSSSEATVETADVYELPLSWLQPCRPHQSGYNNDVNLMLRIPFTELSMHVKASKTVKVGGSIPSPFTVSQLHKGLNFSASFTLRTGRPIVSMTVFLLMPAGTSECELRRGIQYNLRVVLHEVSLGLHSTTDLINTYDDSSSSAYSFVDLASHSGLEMGNPLVLSSWKKFMVDDCFQLDITFSDIR